MEQGCVSERKDSGEILIHQWKASKNERKGSQEGLEVTDDEWEYESFVVFRPEDYKIAYSKKTPRTSSQIDRIIDQYLDLNGEAVISISGKGIHSTCAKCGLKMVKMDGKLICFQCGTI